MSGYLFYAIHFFRQQESPFNIFSFEKRYYPFDSILPCVHEFINHSKHFLQFLLQVLILPTVLLLLTYCLLL